MTACSNKQSEIQAIEPEIEIAVNEKTPLPPVNHIQTTEKKMALTFNGLADQVTMKRLLDQLKMLDIHATFFLQGMKVAEEPELVQQIIEQGHTIQNNTLNHVLIQDYDYDQAYVELFLANKVFKEELELKPAYVRSRSGDTSTAFEEAAAQLDMRVVTNTINPNDGEMQSAAEIADYIDRFTNRGAVIQLNTYLNPEVIQSLELIKQNAAAKGYTLNTLEEVMKGNYVNEEVIPVTNNLQVNLDYKEVQPNIIRKFATDKKEVALTFDDWASDETLSQILDILDQYQISSTFFVIGRGVEINPQLARLIEERGHEVASHSYHHQVITEMGTKELQEDVVLNDQILTEALQEKPLNYFRPAQGLIDDRTAKAITATGVDYIILFDIASLDWDLNRPEDEIYHRIVDNVQPGSIIGLHILDESHTIQVLPRVIENLQSRGYEFKKISEWVSQ
nr:polysaccharide deacetylase family protein [Gracilibacillus alcaliphilus]